MSKPQILMMTAELAPLVKVGGLADVVGVLPGELKKRGVEARVVMPLYKKIKERYADALVFRTAFELQLGWRRTHCGLFEMDFEGVTLYFIDNEFYFGHDAIYVDYDFDIERYVYFQRAALACVGEKMDFWPDVLHCHDWQSGLVPVLLKAHYQSQGLLTKVKTVYTIHNLKYQGVHGYDHIADLSDLSADYLNDEGVLYYGVPNFMKAGIVYSDAITTVSETYAHEILSPFYGEGLSEVLKGYAYKMVGILNGIDGREYNPETDRYLEKPYGVKTWQEGKLAAKRQVRERMQLSCPDEWPLMAMIGRLVDQKGMDLLLRVIDELLETPVQLIVLGTGDAYYEEILREKEWQHRDRFRACILFDNALAHRLYAASDVFLMPSIFEPCGLSQMIAMRYGSLPVVRETGGLKDTVEPYNAYTGDGTGFSFANINAHEFLFTCRYAADVYRYEPENWEVLLERAMEGDYTWAKSIERYIACYERVLSA